MRRLILDGDLPTSSELAKEAGVSTTTIYNHFPESIQGILRELIKRIDQAAGEAAAAKQPQGGREMTRAVRG
ncbi:MAG: TetR/AcrR family transcriptional regulator [Ilumatobacter sp.]